MFDNNFLKRWYARFLAPDQLQRETYDAFKQLLEHDSQCHELIAVFQDLYYKDRPVEWLNVIDCYNQLYNAVSGVVYSLATISSHNDKELQFYLKKIDGYIRYLLTTQNDSDCVERILWFDENIDEKQGGNKAANLFRIKRSFPYDIPVGFVFTTKSWVELVSYNSLQEKIEEHLINVDLENMESIQDVSFSLTQLIMDAKIPPGLEDDTCVALDKLSTMCNRGRSSLLAVRSSGVNEDGPNSFAGQYQSVLNVSFDDVLEGYLKVLSSKYSPEAILYRVATGVSDQEAPMGVLVLEMVESVVSGVIYTEDPTGETENTIAVHSVTGLGEKLVSGSSRGVRHFVDRESGTVSGEVLSDNNLSVENLQALAEIGTSLENYFNAPQDIEWAISGGEISVLQSRPLKVTDCFSNHIFDEEDSSFIKQDKNGDIDLPLLYHGGVTAAKGKVVGEIYYFNGQIRTEDLPEGSVLVVDTTPASLILILSRCNGVIATGGSVASHFATICREFGIPLIVTAKGVENDIEAGVHVTLDADGCKIYEGIDKRFVGGDRSIESSREQLPYYRRLQSILEFIAPLTILDPDSKSFIPGSCRSLHDIVRYAHEKGVQAMFEIGKSGSRHGYKKKLITDLPFDLYVIDVEKSRQDEMEEDNKEVDATSIESLPFKALWKGMTHRSIVWGDHEYYDWKEYDNAALTDGFAFKNESASASYAVYGRDYLNLNIKFGYHFTLVDCLCSENSEQNYCTIRFAGGGGTFEGRFYRLQFIETILSKIGFQVQSKTDLIDAKMEAVSQEKLEKSLVTLGRMLGTTKLMDMVLRDEATVVAQLQEFFRWEEDETTTEQTI